MSTKSISLFDRAIMRKAVADSFLKLNPRLQLKNPVMFVTLVGAILTFQQLFTSKEPFGYVLQIALWLLFTVVFANFAEAVAEGRGKAQARALRASRKQLVARNFAARTRIGHPTPGALYGGLPAVRGDGGRVGAKSRVVALAFAVGLAACSSSSSTAEPAASFARSSSSQSRKRDPGARLVA